MAKRDLRVLGGEYQSVAGQQTPTSLQSSARKASRSSAARQNLLGFYRQADRYLGERGEGQRDQGGMSGLSNHQDTGACGPHFVLSWD